MAHEAQMDFVKAIHRTHRQITHVKSVLEIGSLNINGSVREMWIGAETYTGVDLAPGPGVDVVSCGEDLKYPDGAYELVLSCECLEHARCWNDVFANMCRIASRYVLMTCAGTGRAEHGTSRSCPETSPHTNDYYRNLTVSDLRRSVCFEDVFSYHRFDVNTDIGDLYFFGIKR